MERSHFPQLDERAERTQAAETLRQLADVIEQGAGVVGDLKITEPYEKFAERIDAAYRGRPQPPPWAMAETQARVTTLTFRLP